MRLIDIAHAKSGDKGDSVNIGLIARDRSHYALLEREVTADRVAEHFAGICLGEVRRYELPNLGALNFVLESALGGGGTASLRVDAQGKAMGEALLLMEIDA
ncbi:hypothetical protein K6U06_16350 [Acidiferrimicrobium sp. IK]|uniref:AtuA-related protein n=1 Tax=Acidiferrimicrobium sp. IK TaxID=2871700 RepID=UPI0021CB42F8|nr:hypothetical protein [Acidiferrimicrobium sp. IK]MCU4185943.1 hypothetical protein [Acidiferrimicrobium sp. IK]